MAVIFMDGFDHYASTDAALKGWNNNFLSMQTGRFSGQAARVSSSSSAGAPKKSLATTYSTLILGFAIRVITLPTAISKVVGFYDGSGNLVATLCMNAAGNFAWYRGDGTSGGTLVGSLSSAVYSINTWYYVEVKVTLATGATGSIEVRVGGSSVIGPTSSVQTANTTANMQSFQLFGVNANNTDYDDLYFCDTTGSANNTFLGDRRIIVATPNANGRLSQWTTQVGGTTSQPWTAVNETTPDGDTSYIADSTTGHIHDFTLSSVSVGGVNAVQVNVDMRKDDAGTHTLGTGVGDGTTENFDAGTAVPSSYAMAIRTMDTNPLTSAAWATSDLASLQACVKVIA